MKQLRRICGSFVLLLALSMTAFPGETQTPPCDPGETSSPPCVAGDIHTPGIAGDILGPGLNFLLSVFY